MSWHDKKFVWLETDHPLDHLGHLSDLDQLPSDVFDAKQIYILKERSLPEFIEGLISMSDKFTDVIVDLNLISGLALTISVLCLVPLEIQSIEDDEHAKKFLSLLKIKEGQHYFIETDLNSNPEIKYLVNHFVELGLLKRTGEKLLIQGKVLNRIHLVDI